MNNPRIPGRPGLSRGAPQPPPGRPRPGQPGRPFRPTPAKMNALPIVLGATGVLLVVLLFLFMSGGNAPQAPVETAAPPPPKPAAPPKPVDVSGLERDGRKACDDGLAKFRAIESKMAADLSAMSEANQATLREELKTILELFRKGMAYLNEANEKSGRGYDVKDYMQARKLAADKFKQLGGKLDP